MRLYYTCAIACRKASCLLKHGDDYSPISFSRGATLRATGTRNSRRERIERVTIKMLCHSYISQSFTCLGGEMSYGVFRNFLTFLFVDVVCSTVLPNPSCCAHWNNLIAFETEYFLSVGAQMCF